MTLFRLENVFIKMSFMYIAARCIGTVSFRTTKIYMLLFTFASRCSARKKNPYAPVSTIFTIFYFYLWTSVRLFIFEKPLIFFRHTYYIRTCTKIMTFYFVFYSYKYCRRTYFNHLCLDSFFFYRDLTQWNHWTLFILYGRYIVVRRRYAR